MSKQLVHQLGGNIAKQLVKNADMAFKEAGSMLKKTEKLLEKMVTQGMAFYGILFWVCVVALVLFVFWKPWKHLVSFLEDSKKDDEKKEAKDAPLQ